MGDPVLVWMEVEVEIWRRLGKATPFNPPPQKKKNIYIYIYIVNIPSLDNPEHKLKTTWSGLPNSPIKENDTNSNSHYCHYRFSRPR